MSDIVDIVFPPDTRQQVGQTLNYPYSAIGRIVVEFPDGAKGWGTGTIIDNRHVLTAAHNLWSKAHGGFLTSAKFIPAETVQAEPFGEFRVEKVWVPEEYTTTAPPDPDDDVQDFTQYIYDFGLLRVAKEFPNGTGEIGYTTFPDQTITSATIEIAGYPGDLAKTHGVGTMWTAHGNVSLSENDDLIFYQIDTFKGESGASLLVPYQNRRYICGIHVAGSTEHKTNFAVRLNQDNVDKINGWLNQ